MRNLPVVTLLIATTIACDPAGEVVWQEDPCGRRDPVERTCDTDVETIEVGTDPTCADEGLAAGSACSPEGATCVELRALACADDPDTVIASEQVLTCGEEPPSDICPESRRAVKQGITYVDGPARRALAEQALDVKLATYTYVDPIHDGAGPQLGFILEDAPEAPFSGAERVNLYAYTSAVLAAVQEQQAEITALRARVEELEARECR